MGQNLYLFAFLCVTEDHGRVSFPFQSLQGGIMGDSGWVSIRELEEWREGVDLPATNWAGHGKDAAPCSRRAAMAVLHRGVRRRDGGRPVALPFPSLCRARAAAGRRAWQAKASLGLEAQRRRT